MKSGMSIVNSLERLLRILDQFEEAPGRLTADQLHGRLGYSRSTLYRYLKTLSGAGLITSDQGKAFALGPRIIELHAALMARDPLILSATPVMRELAREFGGTATLYRRFRNRIVRLKAVTETPALVPPPPYGSMALTSAPEARVVLANLGVTTVRKMFVADPGPFAQAGIGHSLPEVRKHLRAIRERGFAAELMPPAQRFLALAAPIMDGEALAVASLCLTLPASEATGERLAVIAGQLMDCATVIGYAIGGTKEDRTDWTSPSRKDSAQLPCQTPAGGGPTSAARPTSAPPAALQQAMATTGQDNQRS